MKRLKILLPAIALIVVLAFSITIGVYAATTSTFNISSTVSFQSPDVDAIVKCFVGTDTSGEANYTYPNDGEEWLDLSLSFTRNKETGKYLTSSLSFVIENKTGIPIYAYFVKKGGTEKQTTDELFGNTDKTTKMVDVVLGENLTGIEPFGTDTVTIDFSLLEDTTTKGDTTTFNYTLVLTKFKQMAE